MIFLEIKMDIESLSSEITIRKEKQFSPLGEAAQ